MAGIWGPAFYNGDEAVTTSPIVGSPPINDPSLATDCNAEVGLLMLILLSLTFRTASSYYGDESLNYVLQEGLRHVIDTGTVHTVPPCLTHIIFYVL
jgi:hypothetical protein